MFRPESTTSPQVRPALDLRVAPRQARPLRTEAQLLSEQLRGIERRVRESTEDRLAVEGAGREAAMDRGRYDAAYQRELNMIDALTATALLDSHRPFARPPGRRAVIAHRQSWFREKISAALAEAGIVVIAQLEDGAHATGAVIAEQPDLLLLEELLPSLSALEVLHRSRSYAPDLLCAVQTQERSGMQAFLDVGAEAVATRKVPPADLARELAACLDPARAAR